MTIVEVIRQRTISLRDSLTELARQLEETRSEYQAADARVKRSGTEISKCREEEKRWRNSVESARSKAEGAQEVLEELERKKREALDVFLQLQREQDEAAHKLSEAQSATQSAQADIKREQSKAEGIKERIEELRGERAVKQCALRQVLLQALDHYLGSQAERLSSAFKTNKEQVEASRVYDAFREARHSDPEVSSMCEQREELLKLRNTALVPNVQQMLQESLKAVEAKIEQRFPGVLVARSNHREEAPEDLLYYCENDGKVTILLPVSGDAWISAATDEPSEEATRAMCLVWNLLRELKLKAEDGRFREVLGRPVFQSQFDIEDISIFQGFSVKRHKTEVMRYVFSDVPAELREAMLNENQDA